MKWAPKWGNSVTISSAAMRGAKGAKRTRPFVASIKPENMRVVSSAVPQASMFVGQNAIGRLASCYSTRLKLPKPREFLGMSGQ